MFGRTCTPEDPPERQGRPCQPCSWRSSRPWRSPRRGPRSRDGVNYNGIWAGLGEPVSMFDVHSPFHVWARMPELSGGRIAREDAGSRAMKWSSTATEDDGDDEECNGGDPMFSSSSASGAMRRRMARSFLVAIAPADGTPQTPHLGRSGLLHPYPRHRLPHALRPPSRTCCVRVRTCSCGRFSGGLGSMLGKLCAIAGAARSA